MKYTKQPTTASLKSPAEHASIWDDGPPPNASPLSEYLAASYSENNYRFVPLVNKLFKLTCSLEIILLRQDSPDAIDVPKSVLDGHGDLDNRLKSLIDGLRMPGTANELEKHPKPGADEDPFYVLLEDDKLITEISITSDTLLKPVGKSEPPNTALAIVTANIKPYDISTFNLGFH